LRTFPVAANPAIELFFNALASDGTNFLAGYQSSTNIAAAQMISPTGSRIGAPVTTNVTKIGSGPFLAFDGTNYLMAWSTSPGDDIYAQRISPAGLPTGPPIIISERATGYQTISALAFGGGKYLASWKDGRNSNQSIFAQLINPNGTLSGAELMLTTSIEQGYSSAISFDGEKFLVVWQGKADASVSGNNNVFVRFVRTSGVLSNEFLISQTSSPDQNPLAVAFNGTNYLVAWNHNAGGNPGPDQWEIYGRIISVSGAFPGNQFTLAGTANQERFPWLTFDGSDFLFSWSENAGTTNSNCKFRFLDAQGQPAGPLFTVFPPQGTNLPSFAASVFDGSRFLAAADIGSITANFAIASGDVYGAFIPKSTAPPRLDPAGPLLGGQFPLLLTGTPGINYAIQVRTNLVLSDWAALVTNSPTGGRFNFIDTQATAPARFYRAVKQ